MKRVWTAIRLYLGLTIVLGLAYPLLVTGLGQVFFSTSANGGLIVRDGRVLGINSIAQKFTADKFFYGRPSANDYDPLNSGGTNLGPTSKALQTTIAARRRALIASGGPNPPAELVFASSSGLDPHVTPETLIYQVDRVAKARNVAAGQVRALIVSHTEKPALGLFGPPLVNVVRLNLALEELSNTKP